MNKNENAALVNEDDAPISENEYSTFCDVDASAGAWYTQSSFPDEGELDFDESELDAVYTEQFLGNAAKGFVPSPYCPRKDLVVEAEAYAARVICDDLRAHENPHDVPLDKAALAIGRIMQFIARAYAEKNDDGSIKKAAFVPPARSETTCAELILAHERIVAIYPDNGDGSPLDTDDKTGLLGRYVFDGRNEGIYVRATESWFYGLVAKCHKGQTTTRFSDAVARAVENRVKGAEKPEDVARFHVVETVDENLIAFSNGLYDIERGELLPFTPDVILLRKCLVAWSDSPAPCPFTRCDGHVYETPVDLIRSWVSSDELAYLLLQLVRLVISNQKMTQMVTFYNTEGANGKSTYLTIWRRLLGNSAVLSPTVEDLSSKFALGDLAGKRLIGIDDTEGGDFLRAVGRMKSVISGERAQSEKKGKDPTYVDPNVVIACCANNFILTRDKSGGWLRRQLFIPFSSNLAAEGVEDPRVGVWSTSPAFLTWLAHYVLIEVEPYDKRKIPDECRELLREYELSNDAVLDFFDEVIEAIPSQANPDDRGRFCDFVSVAKAFKGYQHWAKENRPSQREMNSRAFARSFRAAAAASPNWTVETDGKNQLKQYRAASYANKIDKLDTGAILFDLGVVYDNAARKNVMAHARALTQCGKSGTGRGIIRVYPAPATPADDDSTPER